MSLPTRKEIRLENADLKAELEQLKSPEGLADYLLSKKGDENFVERMEAHARKRVEEAEQNETEPSTEEAPAP